MKILEVKNLTKIYGHEDNQVVALKDISFTVEKGEFIAIVGSSPLYINHYIMSR